MGAKGGVMTMHRVQLGSSVLLATVVAFGTVAQAADQTVIYLARAIGEEAPPPEAQTTPKTAPTKKAPPAAQKPVVAAKPTPKTPEPPPPESKGISKTWIWVGAGVAALLAAAAGGGGGGGGAAATSHTP